MEQLRGNMQVGIQGRKRRGQTLVVAILIMLVMAIVALSFTTIIGNNIRQAGESVQRTLSSDLASSGIEIAHYQLQFSTLGADWRPVPTPPDTDGLGFTRDPDALYLRPGSGLTLNSPTGVPFTDLGGPDGLGSYTRYERERGRVLVRVRYAPADEEPFAVASGALRRAGRARSYIQIESVGREGLLTTGNRIDPSRLLPERVQITGFANVAELEAALGQLRNVDNRVANSRKLIAFASLGVTESARFITNKNRVNAPAEIGFPTPGSGAFDATVGAQIAGNIVTAPTVWGAPAAGPGGTAAFGSLWSNADVVVHGQNLVSLNPDLGELWAVAGSIRPANENSAIQLLRAGFVGTQTNPIGYQNSPIVTLAGNQLDSRNGNFTTVGGAIRDGGVQRDPDGFPRGVGRKEPPSIEATDPNGNANRLRLVTRNSGRSVRGFNLGILGFGEGIYVDSAERGNIGDEDERAQVGAARSLPNDWLNPNNTGSVAWQGPYYRPIATSVELLPDGFIITRDSRSNNRTWRVPNWGAAQIQDSGNSRIRYRIRQIQNPATGAIETWILNDLGFYRNPGGGAPNPADLVSLPNTALSNAQFLNFGSRFNGVLYFEGDVRVRGVIPTNHQITLITMGTAYIDGSITKGRVADSTNGNPITPTALPAGTPSRSLMAIMARDYVAVNTTAFFSPGPGENPSPKLADNLPNTPNPVELDFDESRELVLRSQFISPPGTSEPFVTNYGVQPRLLMSSSTDNSGPSFVSLDIAPQTFADLNPTTFQSLVLPTDLNFGGAGIVPFNAAADFFAPGDPVTLYGLGNPTINAYPRFETVGFPLSSTLTFNAAQRKINLDGGRQLAVNDETLLRVRLEAVGLNISPQNFLLGRTAVTPYDVRIDAALFAEEGSFFVIPGPAFNGNSEDSRFRFENRVAAVGADEARRERFELFGHGPHMPFFEEPLNVRIVVNGSITENMPAPMSQQSEWLKRWGWMPTIMGASGEQIPALHRNGFDTTLGYVPNLIVQFDPILGLGGLGGPGSAGYFRVDNLGRSLPPLPRLPVSPTLAYFGEVNP